MAEATSESWATVTHSFRKFSNFVPLWRSAGLAITWKLSAGHNFLRSETPLNIKTGKLSMYHHENGVMMVFISIGVAE